MIYIVYFFTSGWMMTEMLTAKDIQNLLQVDRSTVYRMAEKQQLPAIKVGKQWRFPSDQVARWLNHQAPAVPVQPETSTSSLADLLPLECVQLIQDTFADTLGIMLVVTDMAGKPITDVSNPCGLFLAVSEVPNALQKCIDSWRTLAVTIDLEPKFTPSHLGLLCARGLVRVGTELKGMVMVGGIAPANWPPTADQVRAIATEFGVKPDTLREHLSEVFYLDKAQQSLVLSTVQRIADIIAHIVNERNTLMGKLESIARLTR